VTAGSVDAVRAEYTTEIVREEIFIALVGAMGTNLDAADEILAELLRDYNYDVIPIRISALIKTVPPYTSVDPKHAYNYRLRMIEGGNYICEKLVDKAALADLAIAEIVKQRKVKPSGKRHAVTIHSLKRPDEVRRLREVYGGLFYTVAIFADVASREQRLTRELNANIGRPDDPEGRFDAQRLMRIDEREDKEWGQKVSDTFAEADYFVRNDNETELRQALSRFLTLVFRKPYVSPSREEVAMMHAYSGGLRSADLSRQIGAVIAARDGRILSTGCNEVPRPGGGQYWASDQNDARDFKLGRDMNDLKKHDAIVELLQRLDAVILPEHLLDGIEDLYEKLFDKASFKGTRVDALVEFGRVLHAEMAALSDALLGQVAVRDADLFCTTFPCHMCTRQIIGAGIRNVFYIEPYPKSAALDLYGKTEILVNPSLTEEQYAERIRADAICDARTCFLPFQGVAPRRYTELFANGRQKNDDGTVVGFDPRTAKPRRTPSFVAIHREAEDFIAQRIREAAEALRKGTASADSTARGAAG